MRNLTLARPAVEAVRQRASGQAEHQLRGQVHGADGAGDRGRMGERRDQQRVGDHGGLGAGVGENLADPEQPETAVAPERDRPRPGRDSRCSGSFRGARRGRLVHVGGPSSSAASS